MSQVNPGLGEELEAACEVLAGELQRSTLPVETEANMGEMRWFLEEMAEALDRGDDTNALDFDRDQMTGGERPDVWLVIKVLKQLLTLMASYAESAGWAVYATLDSIYDRLVAAWGGAGGGGTGTDADDDEWEGEVVTLNGHTMLAVACKRAA